MVISRQKTAKWALAVRLQEKQLLNSIRFPFQRRQLRSSQESWLLNSASREGIYHFFSFPPSSTFTRSPLPVRAVSQSKEPTSTWAAFPRTWPSTSWRASLRPLVELSPRAFYATTSQVSAFTLNPICTFHSPFSAILIWLFWFFPSRTRVFTFSSLLI